MGQNAEDLKRLVGAILAECDMPALHTAPVHGTNDSVTILLGGESITLTLADPQLPLRVAYLKRCVIRATQDLRADAMLKAADLSPDTIPPWLITAWSPVAEWIAWAGCLDGILRRVRASRHEGDGPLPSGRVSFDVALPGHDMSIRGGLHRGLLNATIDFGTKPACRYVDEPRPTITIEGTALPETILDALDLLKTRNNRGLRVGDVLGHPFLTAYDAPIAAVQNLDGAIDITVVTGQTTLAPIPAAALRAMPPDADPARPFDVTRSERETLNALTWAYGTPTTR